MSESLIFGIIGFFFGSVVVGFLIYNYQSRKIYEWQTKFNAEQNIHQNLISSQSQLLETQKSETNSLKQQMILQFENLAHKIFDDKTNQFSDQNQKQLSSLLDPLKERIKDFEKKVEDTYSQERFERGHLKGEISKLIELNHSMSKEAQNLVLALKGENKTQGNWGELILENILERSGLRKGEEYFTQETLRGTNGEMLRPDVIVNLPDGKHLIVDSKMTLNAYENYCSAEDEATKQKAGLMHVDSLKRHVNELSEKKYHLADKMITPDFVILFMPLEPAFSLAFQLKPEIFSTAWDKHIAIVSPTTLLATLRTISYSWKQDRQQKNAFEIAKRGGDLYDKFAGLVVDLDTVSKKIKSLSESQEQVMNKITTGKGNLISQVEKLKELGAKAEKSLPLISE